MNHARQRRALAQRIGEHRNIAVETIARGRQREAADRRRRHLTGKRSDVEYIVSGSLRRKSRLKEGKQ